jgi:acyl-CoA thioester hydrolase
VPPEAPLPGQPQDRPLPKSIDPVRLELGNYPFRISIDTQFADMDVVAHLNNVAIARYYENARVRSNFALFGGDFYRRSAQIQMVLAQANISYLAEGNFPEPVQVGCGIGRIGNSSFVMQQGLFQEGACIGLCDSVMVLTANRKPTPIPPQVREAMQGLMMPAR